MTKQIDFAANIDSVLDFIGVESGDYTYTTGKDDSLVSTIIRVRDICRKHPRLIGQFVTAAMCGKLGNISLAGLKTQRKDDSLTYADLEDERAEVESNWFDNGTFGRQGGGANGDGGLVGFMWEEWFDRVSPLADGARRTESNRTALKAKAAGIIRKTYGEKEKATFAKLLDASALAKSKREGAESFDVIRKALGDDYREKALARLRADREASATLEVADDIDALLA